MEDFLCVCSEEWCWCTNHVPGIEEACGDCARGAHQMEAPEWVQVRNRETCLACAAGLPGRHPDATGTHPAMP